MPQRLILDEGYSWVVFVASFLNQIVSLGCPFSVGQYNVEYLEYFGETKSATAWIFSINIGLLLGAGPLAAWLMDRFSARSVACVGALLSTVGALASIFCTRVFHLYITHGVISGLGYCMVFMPSSVIVGQYFSKYRSATTAGCSAGAGLGMFSLPFLYAYLLEKYSWRGSLYIQAGLNLHQLVFSALFRPQATVDFSQAERERSLNIALEVVPEQKICSCARVPIGADYRRGEISDSCRSCSLQMWDPCLQYDIGTCDKPVDNLSNAKDTTKDPMNLVPNHSNQISEKLISKPLDKVAVNSQPHDINKYYDEETTKHVMLDFKFLVYFLSNIFWNTGTGIVVIITVDYLYETGTPKEKAGIVMSFGGLGSLLGGAVAGIVGNHPRVSRLMLYMAVNVLAGVFCSLYLVSTDFVAITILMALFSFSMGGIVGLLLVLCADITGMGRLGQGFGYLMFSNGIGNLAGPPLAGLLFDVSGSYRSSLVMSGVLNILGGLSMLLIPLHIWYKGRQPRSSAKAHV